MKQIKVYHNPHILDYQGNHSQIIPPTQPVASVQAPAEMPLVERLGLAFRHTQHTDSAWFNKPEVITHLRSTSVGDPSVSLRAGSHRRRRRQPVCGGVVWLSALPTTGRCPGPQNSHRLS